jgi:hypothetical protein
MRKSLNRLIVPIVFCLAASSCTKEETVVENPPADLTPAQVAGAYQATVFKLKLSAPDTLNLLLLGSTMNITLGSDLSMRGRLFVNDTLGVNNGNGDLDRDLAGTFQISRDTLHLRTTADTFVRDVSWVYKDNQFSSSRNPLVVMRKR